jgi:hypothetical protein
MLFRVDVERAEGGDEAVVIEGRRLPSSVLTVGRVRDSCEDEATSTSELEREAKL